MSLARAYELCQLVPAPPPRTADHPHAYRPLTPWASSGMTASSAPPAGRSKCSFGEPSVPLGHIISAAGVAMDDKKVQAVMAWPQPKTTRALTLKTTLTTTPILQLLDFSAWFIVECDAFGTGLGVVLHQGSDTITFFSRPIASRHHALAAYERELMAVRHWRPYLWGRSFLVRTDHYNLKFLLDQHLATIPQHQWVSKLLSFDFSVEY